MRVRRFLLILAGNMPEAQGDKSLTCRERTTDTKNTHNPDPYTGRAKAWHVVDYFDALTDHFAGSGLPN